MRYFGEAVVRGFLKAVEAAPGGLICTSRVKS